MPSSELVVPLSGTYPVPGLVEEVGAGRVSIPALQAVPNPSRGCDAHQVPHQVVPLVLEGDAGRRMVISPPPCPVRSEARDPISTC